MAKEVRQSFEVVMTGAESYKRGLNTDIKNVTMACTGDLQDCGVLWPIGHFHSILSKSNHCEAITDPLLG